MNSRACIIEQIVFDLLDTILASVSGVCMLLTSSKPINSSCGKSASKYKLLLDFASVESDKKF